MVNVLGAKYTAKSRAAFNPRNRANLFYSPLRLCAAFRGFFSSLVK
jgi:hypothetical protein